MAATMLLLFAAPAVRAQVPENPLRAPVTVRITDDEPEVAVPRADFWEDSPASPVQPIAAQEALPPPDPQTIVPQRFGQPPAATYKSPGEPWPAGSPTHDAGHDSWVQPWFTHTDPNDPYRHSGVGRPLVGTSWLNRPWYVGAFLGGLLADDLIGNHVETNNSFFIGGRLGWDFDHYWGLEGRYAFSRPQINDGSGDTLPDPAREYFADVSLAYYPWGDSQWRPFVSLGAGFQTFRFHDDADERIHQSLLSTPLGVGLKFFHSPYHTLRLEAYDNIAWGDGKLATMQNFTLAAGVEFRFGGRPTSYFPWHGSTSYW
jgi:outer membrane protein with beta-barrel domain